MIYVAFFFFAFFIIYGLLLARRVAGEIFSDDKTKFLQMAVSSCFFTAAFAIYHNFIR